MWIILGAMLIIFGILTFAVDDLFNTKKSFILTIVICITLGLGAIFIDVFSPVDIYTRTIHSNDYKFYDLNIDSTKLGIIEITEYIPTIPEAEIKKKEVYIFKGFVE